MGFIFYFPLFRKDASMLSKKRHTIQKKKIIYGISLKIILSDTKKPLFSKKEGFKLYKIPQITYRVCICITKLLLFSRHPDGDTNLYKQHPLNLTICKNPDKLLEISATYLL